MNVENDTTIFNEGDQPNEGSQQPEALVIPDNVKDLIGEGKKYNTVAKALEALGHSQAHIAKLEREAQERRDREAQVMTQDEVLRTVREVLEAERGTHGAVAQVDEATLGSVFDRKLAEREENAVKARNVQTVKKAMLEKYGDKADEVYRTKAQEIGVGTDFLNGIVAKSPEAAFKVLGLEGKPNAGTATKGTVNTSALSQQVPTNPPAKSVMRGAPMNDILAEWRRHDPLKKQE